MPELPEVEIARRLIAGQALHRRIADVDDSDSYVVRPHSPGELRNALTGRSLSAAHRRGKTIWLETSPAGGTGEKKTLRLVAQYADACNVFDIPDGGRTVRHKLDVLARHCERTGRPYADVEKTISTRLDPAAGPGAFADQCSRLAALGIAHAVVITNGPWTPAKIAMLTGGMHA